MGRGLLGITLVAALLFTSHAGVAAEGRLAPVSLVGRPNIVVVMVDDLDVASLKRMLATPSDVPGRDSMMHHLKRSITDVGFELTNAFVTNSLCCPSRATFLTGKYSHNHGVLTNWRPTGGVTLLDDSSTLATWLRAAGYRTGYVGKYLNGYGSWNDSHASYRPGTAAPDRRLEPTYVPPGWDRWWGLIDPFTYLMYGYRINENGVERRYGTEAAVYQTDTLAQHARTFIGESLASAGNQPFFLLVTPLAPHIDTSTISSVTSYKDVWRWTVPPAPRHVGTVPVSGTPEYESKPSFNETDLTDKPFTRPLLDDMDRAALRKQYQDRLESLRAVDDLIGTLVDALGPAMANTMLIFTSDNGYLYGEHRLSEKLALYEESIRVPLYVRVPLAQLQAWGAAGYARRTVEAVALNNDLAPTIAAFAGATTGSTVVDGRSLVPVLRSAAAGLRAPAWRRRFLVEHWWTPSALELETYAAVRNYVSGGGSSIYAEYYPTDPTTLRVQWSNVIARELYDLVSDPYQVQNRPDGFGAWVLPGLSGQLYRLRVCGRVGEMSCREAED